MRDNTLRVKKPRDWYYWIFMTPALVLFSLFIVAPTVGSVYYSFTNWDGISPRMNLIGLQNYIEIFTSARFGNALKNTIILTMFVSVLENVFALALALLVDKVIKAKNFFRSIFYIPVLVSGIVSGFIWKVMYNYNFGVINSMLRGMGLENLTQDWLGDTRFTLIAIGTVLVWKGVGYYMIIYLASLQSISSDVLEAAMIDGAGPWQKFTKITMPLISGAFTVNFTLSLINGLKIFDQINVMTDGGPGFTSETLVYLLYKVGFNEGRQGFGTAVGIVLLFLILILNGAQQKFLKSREVQL